MSLQETYAEEMAELEALAEIYCELRAAGKSTLHINRAIDQCSRATRRLEEKLRKEAK